MFGLFKRRRRIRAASAGAQIAAAFELLRRDAPGAAFMFARTLVNARALIDDPTMSKAEKIKRIQAEIDSSCQASRVDAGTSALAMRFVQLLLSTAERDAIASWGYSAAFGDIAKAGEQYRALEPRDRQPPADKGSCEILAKQGRTCVGEIVEAIHGEREENGLDESEAVKVIETILAAFDLRDEVRSGKLLPRLAALEGAIENSAN